LGFPLGPDERVPLALSLARLRVADLEHDGPGAGRAFANLTPHRFACLFLNAATLQAFEQNFDVLRRPGANYKRGATAFATEEFGIGAHGEGQLQPYRLDQAGWRENHLDLAVRRNTKVQSEMWPAPAWMRQWRWRGARPRGLVARVGLVSSLVSATRGCEPRRMVTMVAVTAGRRRLAAPIVAPLLDHRHTLPVDVLASQFGKIRHGRRPRELDAHDFIPKTFSGDRILFYRA